MNNYVGVEVQLHAPDGSVWSPRPNDPQYPVNVSTGMSRIKTFFSTTDRVYDGGPIILYYNIIL